MFITVEGIQGSGREALIDKMASEFEIMKQIKVHRADRESSDFGSSIRAVEYISATASNKPDSEITISRAYLDSFYAFCRERLEMFCKDGALEALENFVEAGNLRVPDLTFHLVVKPETARKRFMALNSKEIEIVSNNDYCKDLDIMNKSLQDSFAEIRSYNKYTTVPLYEEEGPDERWAKVEAFIDSFRTE